MLASAVRRAACARQVARFSTAVKSSSNTQPDLIKSASDFSAETLATSLLSSSLLQQYDRDGWLVIPNFAKKSQLKALQSAADQILTKYDHKNKSIFTTDEQERRSDDYFLDSGDKISVFFEEDAFKEDGTLRYPLNQSVNKLGHAMHELDPVFRSYSNSLAHKNVCTSLGMRHPLLAQSMYIFKNPRIGGRVGCHQDSSFLYTTPKTCLGLWIALDDATIKNGCMWAVPGSHKEGLRTRFKLKTEVTPSGQRHRSTYFEPPVTWDGYESKGVPLEVPAGSLVVLHGELIHYSYANTSPDQRHAYTLHIVEAEPYAVWEKDNWMQRDTPFLNLDGMG